MTELAAATADAPVPVERKVPDKSRGGAWVLFGDAEYQVPALAFRDLRDLTDDIAKLATLERGKLPSGDQMAVVGRLVHAALRRNYPEMQLRDVEETLDLGNFFQVMDAVLGGAGLIRGGGPRAGEAVASIGTGSTAT